MKQIALANLTFKDISVRGDKGESPASVLFDTGASLSFIARALAEKIANIVDADRAINIGLADKSTLTIDKMCMATADLGGQVLTDQFYVMENSIADLILGMSTLRKYQIKIDTGQTAVFASLTETKPKEHSFMKELLKKLFAAIGVSATDEEIEGISEDKAVEKVQARLDAIKAEGKPAKPKAAAIIAIPPALLKALKLPEDATESDAIAQAYLLAKPIDEDAREQLVDLDTKVRERDIQDLVNKACAAGDDDMSAKLMPSERQWAIEFARDNFAAAQTFIRNRPKVLAIMNRLPGKSPKGVVIDETQKAINAQLKVDEATFRKYNTSAH
jgi:hypothetical protein